MKKRTEKFISLVIPAYREEKIIENSLLEIISIMDSLVNPYELVCVVDGRLDDSERNAKKVAEKFPNKVRVYAYDKNMGKGHAVRYGFARARGDIIGFVDAGFDIRHDAIRMLLAHFEWYSADIIVGSKRHPASKVTYPWQRRIISVGYQIINRILFGLKVKDTQAGVKFFRKEVLEKVTPRLLVKEFAFDVEILAVSKYLGFDRIYEAPVELTLDFGGTSTVVSKGFLRVIFRTFFDTAAVFYRLKILRYYDDKNKKNWITPRDLTLGKKLGKNETILN